MKIQFLLPVFFLSYALSMQAQDATENAFLKSYGCEYRMHYDSAVSVLKVADYENNYEINLRMGWLYYLASKNDPSVLHYKKAKQLMPASIEPYLGAVYPLSVQEKWNEVLLEYESILRMDAKNYTANFKAGLIYYNRKDYAIAKRYLDVLLNLFPFDYDVVHLSAWNHLMMGNFREARVLFHKALCIKPGDVSSREGLNSIK